jgi:hypothetical protein
MGSGIYPTDDANTSGKFLEFVRLGHTNAWARIAHSTALDESGFNSLIDSQYNGNSGMDL